MNDLKALADEGKAKVGSGVVAIVSATRKARAASSSASPAILTDASMRSIWSARGREALGGKGGGGRPDLAQAGGPDGSKAEPGA